MIRLLKRFADWLDRRFPAKVTITQEYFDDLASRLVSVEVYVKSLNGTVNDQRVKLEAAEKTITAIKDLLAKGGSPLIKTESQRMRDEFVRGEFGRAPANPSVIQGI